MELSNILETDGNLVPKLSDKELSDIKERVCSGYEVDFTSMDDYLDKYEKVLVLAQMKTPDQDKTFPFVGASQIMMPYLAQAAVDFNSRTVPEIVNKRNVAKVAVTGKPTKEKEERAERLASALNHQINYGIKGWGKRHDQALLIVPVVGMYFTKKYWQDGEIKENLITADKMVFDHDSESFEEAPRKSHDFEMCLNDYHSMVVSENYEPIKQLEEKRKDGKQPQIEEDLKMIESHCTLDLDGDGYCEPYIVTWNKDYEEIVRIERRFSENDVIYYGDKVYKIDGEEFFTQTGFIPNLEKPAIYDGWGTLLYDAYETINTHSRQLLDAGTLNNVAGSSGFINSNVKPANRKRAGKHEMIMSQLTSVDCGTGQKLSDQIFTMPFQGPSQGLYQLVERLVEETRTYTTASQSVDVSAGEAASMYLARLQQSLKVPNAIMSRVYRGLSGEFNRVYDLMRRYMPEEEYLDILDWEPEVDPQIQAQFEEASMMAQQAGQPAPMAPEQLAMAMVTKEEDFEDDVNIIPTADPSLGNQEERIARADLVYQQSFQDPGINQYEARKQWLESLNTPDVELLAPQPTGEPSQQDLVNQAYMESEIASNQADVRAKNAKAFKDEVEAEKELIMTEPEIDEMESKTVKNLSEVDKNERGDLLAMTREEREIQQLGETNEESGAARMAQTASNEEVSGSPQTL